MATLPGAPAGAIIGYAKQSAAGTGLSPTSYFPVEAIGKFTPVLKTEKYRDGTNRDIVFNSRVGEWVEFDFTTQLRPSATTQLLAWCIGATDVASTTTGTSTGTTMTGASNTAGSTSIVVAATTLFAVGDIILITNVGGAVLSEYAQIKTVTDSTHLALQTPLQNSYLASSTVAEVTTVGLYAHSGANANASIPVVCFTFSIGNGAAGSAALDVVRVVDCLIGEYDMTSEGGSHNKVKTSGMGRIGTPGQSTPTVAYESDRALTFADAIYNFTGITITGGTSDITKIHFNIKNTITQVPVHGTIVPQLYNAQRDVTFDAEVYAEDNKLWRDVFWGSDSGTTYPNANTQSNMALRYDLKSTPEHLCQFYLGNVVMEDAAPKMDVNMSPFTFTIKGTAQNQSAINNAAPAFSYLVLNGDTAAY